MMIVPDTTEGAVLLSVIDFVLSIVMISGIGFVLALLLLIVAAAVAATVATQF